MKKCALVFFVLLISVSVNLSQTTDYSNTRSATKNPPSKAKKKTAAPKQAGGSRDYKKFEVYIGYSNASVQDTNAGNFVNNRKNVNGVQASTTYNVSRFVGIKVDTSTHRSDKTVTVSENGVTAVLGQTTTMTNILGGVQLKDNASERFVRPFGHALAGIGLYRQKFYERDCGNTTAGICSSLVKKSGLAGAIGGGLDFRVTSWADVRLSSDYNPIRIDKTVINNFRFGLGVTLH